MGIPERQGICRNAGGWITPSRYVRSFDPHRLALSGVPEVDIEAAFETLAEEVVDPDRRAAIAYAFVGAASDLGVGMTETSFVTATLRRWGVKGFSFDIALWVVDAESPDACEISLSDD